MHHIISILLAFVNAAPSPWNALYPVPGISSTLFPPLFVNITCTNPQVFVTASPFLDNFLYPLIPAKGSVLLLCPFGIHANCRIKFFTLQWNYLLSCSRS